MSFSYSRLASGLLALAAAVGGAAALGGTAIASPADVAAPLTIYKMVQCPPGYVLNPQNTQQCVPQSDPYGGSSVRREVTDLTMWERGAFALITVASVALLAGCGSASTSSSTPSAQARAEQADPCTLLTSAQLRLLRFSKGTKQQASDELGGTTCVWSGYPLQQGPKYTARVLTGSVPAGTPSAAINNLKTSQYVPAGADSATNCGFLINVGSGRTLVVQFSGSPTVRMTHQVACQKAQAAATNIASTYNSRPPA